MRQSVDWKWVAGTAEERGRGKQSSVVFVLCSPAKASEALRGAEGNASVRGVFGASQGSLCFVLLCAVASVFTLASSRWQMAETVLTGQMQSPHHPDQDSRSVAELPPRMLQDPFYEAGLGHTSEPVITRTCHCEGNKMCWLPSDCRMLHRTPGDRAASLQWHGPQMEVTQYWKKGNRLWRQTQMPTFPSCLGYPAAPFNTWLFTHAQLTQNVHILSQKTQPKYWSSY